RVDRLGVQDGLQLRRRHMLLARQRGVLEQLVRRAGARPVAADGDLAQSGVDAGLIDAVDQIYPGPEALRDQGEQAEDVQRGKLGEPVRDGLRKLAIRWQRNRWHQAPLPQRSRPPALEKQAA